MRLLARGRFHSKTVTNPSDQAPAPVPITFLITELDDGGAERALVRIVTGLDSTRWHRRVISLSSRGPLAAPLEAAGIEVSSLGLGGSSKNGTTVVSAFHNLIGLLRGQKPAILQTFLFHANLLGRLAARFAGVPHVLSGIRVAEQRSRWRLTADRWTERFVERHVCVSQSVANFSVRHSGLSLSKLVTIPNGVDYDRCAKATPANLAEFGIEPNSPVILSVGRLDPQKDPLTLLRAFAAVTPQHPEAVLLYVGAGPLEAELKSTAAQLNIQPAVRFAGRRSDIAEIMKASSVFALASRWEGMPNVLLEAGAAGLPIVSTEAEGVREIINPGQTGRLVGIEATDALAQALGTALSEMPASRRMAAELQKIIARDFTWESVVAQYDALYSQLLASDSRSG